MFVKGSHIADSSMSRGVFSRITLHSFSSSHTHFGPVLFLPASMMQFPYLTRSLARRQRLAAILAISMTYVLLAALPLLREAVPAKHKSNDESVSSAPRSRANHRAIGRICSPIKHQRQLTLGRCGRIAAVRRVSLVVCPKSGSDRLWRLLPCLCE
jgi:hypothetical protein